MRSNTEPLREAAGALGGGAVDPGEALDHLGRRAEHGLPVPPALALAPVERRPAADRDERVLEKRPARRVRVDVPRRDRLDAEVLGEVAERRVPPRVAPLVRALELDEEALAAERRREPRGAARVAEREPVAGTAREADEPLVQLGERLERNGGLEEHAVLLPRGTSPGMRRGEDAAEVRVALPVLAKERDVRPAFERHLGAGDRADPGELRRVRELERAVDAVVVGERERLVAELRRPGHELLGVRRPVEERVGGVAVQLDVGGRARGHTAHLVSEPVLIPPGEGELIGDAPHRRVEIVSDDQSLNATWSRFGPHSVGADLHVHHHHVDLFYVLEGELTVRLGMEDEPVAVPAGTLARVPPLVVHGFRNRSDADVTYLNFHTPGQRFSDYLRALRDGRELSYDQHDPPEDGGRPTSEAVVGGDELVADRPGLRVELLADVEEIGISETWRDPAGRLRRRTCTAATSSRSTCSRAR